jgi:predicted nucleic acid-binding Zn ribbon protein
MTPRLKQAIGNPTRPRSIRDAVLYITAVPQYYARRDQRNQTLTFPAYDCGQPELLVSDNFPARVWV